MKHTCVQTFARLKREESSYTKETRKIRAGGILGHLGWSDDEHHDIDGAIHLLQDGTLVYIDGALGRTCQEDMRFMYCIEGQGRYLARSFFPFVGLYILFRFHFRASADNTAGTGCQSGSTLEDTMVVDILFIQSFQRRDDSLLLWRLVLIDGNLIRSRSSHV